MLKQKILVFLLLLNSALFAQVNDTISETDVSRIIGILASDSLRGRGNYTVELHKAADFIANEFKKDSLLPFTGLNSYFQPFTSKRLAENEQWKDSLGRYNTSKVLLNVIGVLEGRSLRNEAIIFSAHYDHIGADGIVGDGINNGANDDASGTTALVALAHYFALRHDNERTLIFCAFAGEELGLYGSNFFVRGLNVHDIVAVVNIEMIGMHNVTGKDAFFLTGSNYSDLNKIMKDNLKGEKVKIKKENNFSKDLFQRSDNYAFALKGVPAHTIMCSD